MHCPDCGQQQVSEETRFCSRCGLPLSLISEVVANRGTLPGLERNKPLVTRKAGMFVGIAVTVFFLLVMAPLLAFMNAREQLVAIAVVFGIFIGGLIITASLMFLKNERDFDRKNPRQVKGAANALPPQQQQAVPAQNYAPPKKSPWETDNLGRPSVTEGTTKLLQDEENL
jgi:hypothetical protein